MMKFIANDISKSENLHKFYAILKTVESQEIFKNV